MNPIDRSLTALACGIGGQPPRAERSARLGEIRGHRETAARKVRPEEAARRFGPLSTVAGVLLAARRQDRRRTGPEWAR